MSTLHTRLLVGVPLIVVVIGSTVAGHAMAMAVQPATASTADGDLPSNRPGVASTGTSEPCEMTASGPFNGLGRSDAALLWSRDDDDGGSGPLGLYDRINRTANVSSGAQQAVDFARQTDRIYQYPPMSADQWTCGAFDTLPTDDSDWNSSLYPQSATRRTAGPIRDAHATIFAITPQTVAHRDSGATRYVAPTGRVLALVDYRVAVPPDDEETDPPEENVTYRRVEWSYDESSITSAALVVDGERRQYTDASSTPAFEYSLADRDGDRVSLGVEAEIRAVLHKKVLERRLVFNNSTNETEIRTRTTSHRTVETVTVSDSRTVTVAEVTASDVSVAKTSGTEAVSRNHMAVHVDDPWAGFTVGNEALRAGTRWNFYTARIPAWDQLTLATDSSTRTVDSRARPVLVHAYPSSFGPFTESTGNASPTQVRGVWGPDRTSGSQLPSTVQAEPATEQYTEVRGLLVEYRGGLTAASTTVYGLVAGQRVSLESDQYETRQRRPSNVSATVTSVNETSIELTITLRDAAAGSHIDFGSRSKSRRSPLTGALDDELRTAGLIVVQGATTDRRYRPSDGRLSVTLPRGDYYIEFRPATWIAVEPAYNSSATTVQMAPLSSDRDGQSLLDAVVVAILPMAVVYYVIHRAGLLYDTITDRPRP